MTNIDETAFRDNTRVTSVTIGDQVTSIGDRAFYGCTNMTSVTVDPGNESFSSEDGALYNKVKTKLILYPGGKAGPFTIPNSVKTTSDYAFALCAGLNSVVIHNQMTSLGSYIFQGCTGLTTATFEETSSLSIPSNAFNGCTSLTSINIPSLTTSIGGHAFYGCTSLTLISIPASVTGMGINTFYGCTSLTSVTFEGLPQIKSINESTFRNCSSLTSIIIPNSVTSLGGYAFYGCTSLNSVTLSNSATSIDGNAFRNCSSLISITIPGSVVTIGNNAFDGCSSLKTITIPSSVTSIGTFSFANCTNLTSFPFESPSHLKSIPPSAFNKCTSLESITIPNSVTSIGNYAFTGCSGLTYVTFEATSSLETIGTNSFGNCSSLKTITIPKSVEKMESQTFSGCSGLTSVIFDAPSSLKTLPGSAFYNCSSIESVIIPNSVTSIGGSAFYNCSGLTSLEFETSSTLTSIADSAFSKCSKLTSVIIPNSVTTLEVNAFNGCSKLESVTIPNSVTTGSSSIFPSCPIKTLTITYASGSNTSSILGKSFTWKLQGQNGEVTTLKIDASDLAIPTITDKTGKRIIFTENATGTTGGSFYDPDGPVLMTGSERAGKEYSYDTAAAKWFALKHTVTFNTKGGSVVTDGRVFDGYDLTEPADPNKYGYLFDGWFSDPELTVPYDFSTPVTSDFTLYAKWTPAFLSTITPSASAGGSISPSDPQDVPYGGITFYFWADAGYRILDVRVNGVSVPYHVDQDGEGTYTFTDVEEGVYTIYAEFEAYHTVTVNDPDNGSVSVSDHEPSRGDDVMITMTPGYGYTLGTLTDNGTNVFDSAAEDENGVWTYTIPSIASDHAVLVTFVKIKYTIAADNTEGGTLSPNGSVIVEHGDNMTFTFEAVAGYRILDLKVNGVSVPYHVDQDGKGTYTFMNVTEGQTIFAEFEAYHTVRVNDPDNGSVSVSDHEPSRGDDVMITMTPGYGYTLGTLTDNGTNVFDSAAEDENGVWTYTIPSIASDHAVLVTFTLKTYDVILTAGEGYTLIPAEGFSSPVYHNGSFAFVFSLDEGYDRSVPVLMANGTELITLNSGQTTTMVLFNIIEDIEITVDGVVINVYTVTLTPDSNMTGFRYKIGDAADWTAYSATFTVTHGQKLEIEALLKTGYHLVDWDGSEDNNPLTVASVGGDIAYSPTSAINVYTVILNKDSGMTGFRYKIGDAADWTAYSAAFTVTHGQKLEIEALLVTGYHFVDWDGSEDNNPLTVASVGGDIAYSPTSAINVYTVTVTSENDMAFIYTVGENDPVEFTISPDGSYDISIVHGSVLVIQAMPDRGYHFQWTVTGSGTADGNVLLINAADDEAVGGSIQEDLWIIWSGPSSYTVFFAAVIPALLLFAFGRTRLRP